MKFEWKGFDKMAKNMDGDIEAASLEDAAERLRKGGIFVQNIVPKPGSATPPPTPEIPAPVAAQPTPPPVPQPAAPAEPPVPQATEQPSEPSAPVGESPEEPLVPWEKDLQDSLRFISDICSFAQSRFSIPKEVVQDAAQSMIKHAIIDVYRRYGTVVGSTS